MCNGWLIAFVTLKILEFALFGMQRASLLISRSAGVPWRGWGEFLLPRWYPLTWVVIIGKWLILASIAVFWNWKFAVLLALGGWIFTILMPIPYSLYKGTFKRRVDEVTNKNPALGAQLKAVLDAAPF